MGQARKCRAKTSYMVIKKLAEIVQLGAPFTIEIVREVQPKAGSILLNESDFIVAKGRGNEMSIVNIGNVRRGTRTIRKGTESNEEGNPRCIIIERNEVYARRN